MRRLAVSSLLALALAPTLVPLDAEPLKLSAAAFDGRVAIEVRNLPEAKAETAIRDAIARVVEVERLTTPSAGSGATTGIAHLNGTAGRGPQPVDPLLFGLLRRAVEFCTWSRGAHGPLGGRLYDLWGLHRPVEAPPDPQQLREAVASAACTDLTLHPSTGTAELAAGSRIDLWGFAAGYAVDQAVALLRQRGATNGFVELGDVRRGFGEGPDGSGWKVVLPVFPGTHRSQGEIWLRDRTLAIARRRGRSLDVGGQHRAPFLDQRRGEPAEGVTAVLVVTKLGVDAQGLATTLFVTGNREGRFRLGLLRPAPSVLWLLGNGNGPPVVTDYHWSDIELQR